MDDLLAWRNEPLTYVASRKCVIRENEKASKGFFLHLAVVYTAKIRQK